MKWPPGHVDRRGFASGWYLRYGTWFRQCVGDTAESLCPPDCDYGRIVNGFNVTLNSFLIGPRIPTRMTT